MIRKWVFDIRFIVLLTLIVTLAMQFWLGSRYPSLNAKALMSGGELLEDGLSFDASIAHSPTDDWFVSTGTTFVNWLATNQQGMLFGFAFAVLIMTLFQFLRPVLNKLNNAFSATIYGFSVGAPLGVCANCAAPIAFGIQKSGARFELAIATMLTSPAFNIVVLSMAFTLFPFYVVVVKIALSLTTVFLVVPLLAQLHKDEIRTSQTMPLAQSNTTMATDDEAVVAPLIWLLQKLVSNTLYLLRSIVPIMLVAGLLGSIAVTILPWEQLIEFVGTNNKYYKLLLLFLVALFGLLIPVPIAFDVFVVAILINMGMPIIFATTLLFVLGSFSIYPYFVVRKMGANKFALSLSLVLLLLGMVAGISTHFIHAYFQAYYHEHVYSMVKNADAKRHEFYPPFRSQNTPDAPKLKWERTDFSEQVELLHLNREHSKAGAWKMALQEHIGLKTHPKGYFHRFALPFFKINSIASGDLNGDSWLDIVIGTSNGVYAYLNTGGEFQLTSMQAIDNIDDMVGFVALYDMNNDGWLDLIFNVYDQGNFVSYSKKGLFTDYQKLISNETSRMTLAAAFADVDKNGELDIILGNYNGAGWEIASPPASRNRLLFQKKGKYYNEWLHKTPAETLTTLLSDINHDGYVDLLVGNDFDEPDAYFLGGPSNKMAFTSEHFPLSTTTTMSIDSADINNDLRLDTYHAQISRNPASENAVIGQFSLGEWATISCNARQDSSNCANAAMKQLFIESRNDVTKCLAVKSDFVIDCIATNIWIEAKITGVDMSDYLDLFAHERPIYDYVLKTPRSTKEEKQKFDNNIRQVLNRNLLYVQNSDAGFVELGEKFGVDIAGWSWNAKFADLDGDEWQDLFVVNGSPGGEPQTENVWFRNHNGESFSNHSEQAGLNEYSATSVYTYIDYDNDGDLDIITFDFHGTLKAYKNQHNPNNHIQFVLKDKAGNIDGIGSRIIIHYGTNKTQVREIKAGGGYLSFDSTVVHFGLGNHNNVNKIDIYWPDGSIQSIAGNFAPGYRYRVTRSQEYE